MGDFVPHRTLGKERYGREISRGMSKHDLWEMGREAKVHLSPYPVLDIGFIRVYRLNDKFVRYERDEDILLVGPKGGVS